MLFSANNTKWPYEQEIINRINSEFFHNVPLRISESLEGARIEDGILTLGCRAGNISHANLAHEMAHLVEIDDNRMLEPGWGLKIKQIYIGGRMCIDVYTKQCTEREIRVIAYQANLLEYIGSTETVEDTIRSLQFLPDTAFIPLEDGSSAYGDDKNHTLNHSEIKESQLRWRQSQVKEKRNQFTTRLFLSEWKRKTSLLKHIK